MITLALELSTVQASIALCENARVLARASWLEGQARHQRLFNEIPLLLTAAGLDWPRVDQFVVGRGPGAFSGLRIALMAAQMFALPLNRPVLAFSSGAALAHQLRTFGAPDRQGPLTVCGDARRGTFWFGHFDNAPFTGWQTCTAAEWVSRMPPHATVVTSQWERTDVLRAAGGPSWIAGAQFPMAESLVELSRAASARSEPLEPIYPHPPV